MSKHVNCRSKFNPYFKALMEDETMLWLKANDPHHSSERLDKGLEYPYLTKRKELFRRDIEIPMSNLSKGSKYTARSYIDLDFED